MFRGSGFKVEGLEVRVNQAHRRFRAKTQTNIHILHTYIRACIHACIRTFTYMQACIHAYIHTYIHTYRPVHLTVYRSGGLFVFIRLCLLVDEYSRISIQALVLSFLFSQIRGIAKALSGIMLLAYGKTRRPPLRPRPPAPHEHMLTTLKPSTLNVLSHT